MEKFKTFSLGIAMLISFLAFGQEKTKSEAGKEDDSTKVIEKNLSGNLAGSHSNSSTASSIRIVFRCGAPKRTYSKPLLIINNTIVSAETLQELKPEYIESTQILKGQEGAALFGEQGINGVIIIKTSGGLSDDEQEEVEELLSKK